MQRAIPEPVHAVVSTSLDRRVAFNVEKADQQGKDSEGRQRHHVMHNQLSQEQMLSKIKLKNLLEQSSNSALKQGEDLDVNSSVEILNYSPIDNATGRQRIPLSISPEKVQEAPYQNAAQQSLATSAKVVAQDYEEQTP